MQLVAMMTSSSTSLCSRRHADLHSPTSVSYASPASNDYRRPHNSYQSTDYASLQRVTSAASTGLHGDAVMHHVQQQHQQLQRSPSFAIHELLGLHGPMLPAAHGMFDCSAAAAGGGGGGGYAASSYQQTPQFFPPSAASSYHSGSVAAPSTPLSMPDLDPLPAPLPPPPPLLPSCHRAAASSSSWQPSASPMTSSSHLLPAAHAHQRASATTYRDAYDALRATCSAGFKPDVTTRAFAAAARPVSHKYATHHRAYIATSCYRLQ